jgi:NADH-ubiquinone oxidoreductase chain 1
MFSAITAILFFGGFNLPLIFTNNSVFNIQSIILGLKTSFFCFVFVWIRATLPRLRFDQLSELCWEGLLPFCVALIISIPCLIILGN